MQEPTFLMLTALAEQPLHGYGLIQQVEKLSAGRVKLRPGTLYGALDRLQRAGQVEVEREEVVGGRLRRYYRLTSEGADGLAVEANRMREVAELADTRLKQLKQNRPTGRRAPGMARVLPAGLRPAKSNSISPATAAPAPPPSHCDETPVKPISPSRNRTSSAGKKRLLE